MYKGYKFTTNKGMNCIVIDDSFNGKYVIVNIDNFSIIASNNYDIIEKLIQTVKNKF